MTVRKWGDLANTDKIPAECPQCGTQVLLSDSEIMQRTSAGMIQYRCPLCGSVSRVFPVRPLIRAAQKLIDLAPAALAVCALVVLFVVIVAA